MGGGGERGGYKVGGVNSAERIRVGLGLDVGVTGRFVR